MKTKILILCFLFSALSCGTKKQTSQFQTKERTDVELVDHSKINTSKNFEKQSSNAATKERIVTMYGVRMVSVPSGKDTIYIPMSYPVRKEENRDIQAENLLWKINLRDSIQNAMHLNYSGKIDAKEKKLIELKESTLIYQIAFLISAVLALLLFLFYVFKR